MASVTLQQLTKRFGDFTAVAGLDLRIADGEFVTFLGPSGCGKSTALACIAGLEDLSDGSIVFDGRDLVTASARELTRVRGAGIGLVPQDPMSNLDPVHRVGAQIVEALEAHGTSSRDSTKRAIELLDMVGLDAQFMQRRPAELSGGQLQRVNIARSLIADYPILLLDEPTASLDTANRDGVIDLIRERRDQGTAIVGIFHDAAVRDALATRVHTVALPGAAA